MSLTSRLETPRFMPYPEIVEERGERSPWKVLDSTDRNDLPSNGVTDMRHRVLYVPLRPDGRGVSLHELAHVRWSPDRLPRVRFPIIVLHAVEDARINLGLRNLGMRFGFDREQRARVALLGARDLKQGRPGALLLRSVAALGTEVGPDLLAEAEAAPGHAAEWLLRMVGDVEARLERARRRAGDGPVAPFEAAVAVARRLARELRARGLLLDDALAGAVSCCLECVGEDDEAQLEMPFPRLRRRPRHESGIQAGRLLFDEVPLRVRQSPGGALGERTWRPATEGALLGRVHRWPVDGAIFRRRSVRRGGSVLVDTSGSMRLDLPALESIVAAARGAGLVAIYSGREDDGQLRVVARGWWRTDRRHLDPYGNGNVVDLPALEWLARQPRPRVWISDGGTTGVGDQSSTELRQRCQDVVLRGHIVRVRSAEEAVAILSGRELLPSRARARRRALAERLAAARGEEPEEADAPF